MLPKILLKTKLVPPRISGQVLARPRLLQRMNANLDAASTIISANAGCGKTTLVADFVHSSGLPFVWYQVDASDGDLGIVFGYLVYGLRRLHPGFGQAVLGFIRETGDLASRADQLADVFLNEVVDQVEDKTIVVMDDFHNVDKSAAIGTAIDRLVQYLPDVLHVILTSRTMPNLSMSRLRSKNLISFIDRRDLLFAPEEVHRLFAETFGRQLPAELIDQFHEKTEGWITALQLIRQTLDRLSDEDQTLVGKAQAVSALRESETDIFDYFAEEVLKYEPFDVRLTLGRVSLFERISPDVCDAVLGEPRHAEKLRSLARRNVFVTRTYESGDEEEYQLHPLFRSFLRKWLESELGSEKVRQLHRMCADYFAGTAGLDMSLYHYAEALAPDAIGDLLASRGAELVELGRFEIVKRAFELIPQELFAGREQALIARADVAMIEGARQLALTLYKRAFDLAASSGDSRVSAESLRGEAYIARYQGEFDQAIALASKAIELCPELHHLRARCFNIIGLCRFLSANDTTAAVESWHIALDEARQAGDDRFIRIVLHNLGLPYSMEGDLEKAVYWISQMLDETPASVSEGSPSNSSAPFPQEAVAHLNLARLKLAQGRFNESESHLELALQRCRMFNLHELKAETLEAFGNLYRERGEYARALDFYDEASRAYRDAGLSLTERELLDERATFYLQIGQVETARRDADAYYQARKAGSVPERVTALITKGRVELAARQFESAEAPLLEAAELTRQHKLQYFEARARTSLARLYWDWKRGQEALEQLNRAVELSTLNDYSYWLSCESRLCPELFEAAAGAGVGAGYVTSLLPDAASAAAGMTASRKTDPITRTSAGGQAQVVPERPGCDLTINMLGPTEIYRSRSEPLPEDTWRLAKSLQILCYLASRRNRRSPKDTLVETFWRDADPGTVARNFHPMISHVRKALNRDQTIKKDFILYREGAYSLNPQYSYQIDTEAFERLIGNASEMKRTGEPDSAAQTIKQAVTLYRGDFLEDLHCDWAEELQSYYRDLYLEALKELIVYYEQRGEYETVIRYGQVILQRDPYREDVHCQVMEAHVQTGNRAAAIEEFARLRQLLRAELGVAPLPATVAKYEALIK